MNRFFDADNPIMKALARLVDLVILNVLTIICAVPIVTSGASLAAMNYVLIKYINEDESYTRAMFIKSFRENLKQGMKAGMVFVVLGIFAAGDMWILHSIDSRGSTLLMIIITVLTGYAVAVATYTFGYMARYENSVKETLVNAVKLSLSHIPSTIGIVIIWLAWVAVLVYLHKLAPLVIILYGFSLPGYMCTLIYWRIFKKLEAE